MNKIKEFFTKKISKKHQERLNEHGLTLLEQKMCEVLLLNGCLDEMTFKEAKPILKKLSKVIKEVQAVPEKVWIV